ncbi:MAG: PQQ-binding-like beta-propeller repeat protein [Ignavibacteriales bacterium]|nr:PQQ-binding-like beta-propeller repeat protein [Ignavibacteriales bacterium]
MKHLFFRFLFSLWFFSFSNAQTKTFFFAWLSDTHVGSTTGADDLRASVRDINSMDSVAFVLLSGDITELGWNAEFDTAKAILDNLKKPYYIVPGNHDTKWSESGCTRFSEVFGSDRFVFEYGGFVFIGLHEGPIMRMGDGHFAPEDLRWIDSVFSSLPDKGTPLFFVTHYPLTPQLDNWYEMTDRLKKLDTKAALVGHGHTNRKMDFEGIPGVMGRSNLRARNPLGGFTIARVDRDSIFFFERTVGTETLPAWHAISLRSIDFSAETASYPRPDYSLNSTYPHVKPRWVVPTGLTIATAPVISNDRVIVGNSSGIVGCYLLEDGTMQWHFRTGAAVYSTPTLSEDKVVFGSSDGWIYCLEVLTGKLVWKFQTSAPVVACPTIHEKIVYIGGSDGKFRALHLRDGSLKWEYSRISAFVETKPLVHQEKVVFGAWDTYLYALNLKDGSLAWKWSNGSPTLNLSPAACWPVAVDNRLFIVAPDRVMTALDATTGKELWRSKKHQVREALGISNDRKRIYAKCMNDTLFAFSSFSNEQELVWATHCGYGYDIDPSMPQEKDGVVFFGHKNGTVFALDAQDGTVKWVHKISNTIVNTVAPLDDRRVVVTDFDGQIVLLENHSQE